LEQNDYDPFRLDPEECNNLSFKWTPFDLRTRERRAPTPGEVEIGAQPPDTDKGLYNKSARGKGIGELTGFNDRRDHCLVGEVV
jgi:hypothetical protein